MASTSRIFSNPSPLPISVATTKIIPSLSKSFKSLISLFLLFSLPYGRFTEQKYKMTPFYYTKSLQRCPNGLKSKTQTLVYDGNSKATQASSGFFKHKTKLSPSSGLSKTTVSVWNTPSLPHLSPERLHTCLTSQLTCPLLRKAFPPRQTLVLPFVQSQTSNFSYLHIFFFK